MSSQVVVQSVLYTKAAVMWLMADVPSQLPEQLPIVELGSYSNSHRCIPQVKNLHQAELQSKLDLLPPRCVNPYDVAG